MLLLAIKTTYEYLGAFPSAREVAVWKRLKVEHVSSLKPLSTHSAAMKSHYETKLCHETKVDATFGGQWHIGMWSRLHEAAMHNKLIVLATHQFTPSFCVTTHKKKKKRSIVQCAQQAATFYLLVLSLHWQHWCLHITHFACFADSTPLVKGTQRIPTFFADKLHTRESASSHILFYTHLSWIQLLIRRSRRIS